MGRSGVMVTSAAAVIRLSPVRNSPGLGPASLSAGTRICGEIRRSEARAVSASASIGTAALASLPETESLTFTSNR